MNDIAREYLSDFARRNVEEGRAKGRAEILLTVLRRRFGPLPDTAEASVRRACSEADDSAVEAMLAAATLQEALEAPRVFRRHG
jgi:hypothetical protein